MDFLDNLITLAKLSGVKLDEQDIINRLPGAVVKPSIEMYLRACRSLGFGTKLLQRKSLAKFRVQTLPCLLILKSSEQNPTEQNSPQNFTDNTCLLLDINQQEASVIFVENSPAVTKIPLSDLEAQYAGLAIFYSPSLDAKLDARTADFNLIKPKRWFWDIILYYLPLYRDVAIASIFVNILALASPLFVMNVYDRVIPNNAIPTLWVLFIGVSIAFIMDYLLRLLRGYYVDLAGRNADVVIANRLMEKVLHLRMDTKPESTGALVNNIREFEQVREFFSSSTLLSVIDIPFILLFILLIYWLGGVLVVIPLLSLPLMLIIGFALQLPFKRSAYEQFKQSMQKNALLIEIVSGLETIKAAGLQKALSTRWESSSEYNSKAQAEAKRLGLISGQSIMLVNTFLSSLIVVLGAYQISAQKMSMGALIACVIILGRVLQPLNQIATLLNQWQKSMTSLSALNKLMALPQEQSLDSEDLSSVENTGIMSNTFGSNNLNTNTVISGSNYLSLSSNIRLENVSFSYPKASQKSLMDINLEIRAGEKIAVMGATGSGKSSLSRLITGLYHAQEGKVLFDGVDINLLDPYFLRSKIGLLPQDNYLFYGSILENIIMSCPLVDDEKLRFAVQVSGVMDFASQHPQGLSMQVGERGSNLSGGQVQAVALARLLIRDPDVLILDEPSSNLDMASEQLLIQRLAQTMSKKTLIILTHRPSMLSLVERLLVLERGRLIADGLRDEVLSRNLQKK